MAVVRKKQDDKNLKILRELITSGGGNRQCFDCGQKGPTYVNMTIGSFVCTRCSGVLRGLTPPHRVKSISMATFTPEEIEFLKGHGNDVCAKTWLGLWDPKRVIQQDQRELMIDKYERKRYYLEPASPLKSLTNTTTATTPKLSSSMSNGNSSSSSNISINSSSSNLNNNNNNGSSSNNNNNNNNFINNLNGSINNNNDSIKNSLVENNYKNMSLTPPSSLRITANGMLGGGTGTGSGGGSGTGGGGGGVGVGNIIGTIGLGNNNLSNGHLRQNNRFNFQTQFTTNENGLYNGNNNIINKNNINTGNNALMNGLNLNGNGNGNGIYSTINKNGLNAIQSSAIITGNASVTGTASTNNNSDKSHGFTPDSDFVADFGSANIFNATAAATNPLNGFKLQSSQQQQHSQNNGISSMTTAIKSTAITNGIGGGVGIQQQNGFATINGSNTTTNHSNVINANENFADFDHAPIIYNAAGLPLSNSKSNSISSSSSLSSATFNSNSSSMNSTPPADRYAALKDLDEQLRESKAAASLDTSFSSVQASQQQSNVNPFKTSLQQQQQQQPSTQSQQIINPFQATFNNNNNNNNNHHHQATTNNIFGTSASSQQMMMTGCGNGNVVINGNGNNINGGNVGFNVTSNNNNNNNPAAVTATSVFGTQPTQISAAAVAVGFNNGYVTQQNPLIANNLNGCNGNLRFGTTNTQQISAGNSIAANLKNPFATTSSLNMNNPFL